MALKKDYYKILNVTTSATAAEIKVAYRKLAMKYHPDHNAEDALAEIIFADAAEAYKILSNAETRKQYNEERYITAAQEFARPAETIETLIIRMQKINEYVINSDPFRFNKDALLFTIKQLLPADINLLENANSKLLTQLLEKIAFAATRMSTPQTNQLILLLQPLYEKNNWLHDYLNNLMLQQRKAENWEKYKPLLAVAIAVILCLIIFLIARK